MRGLKRHRSARIVAAGHAFARNLCRGHYDMLPKSAPATGSARLTARAGSRGWAGDQTVRASWSQ